MFVNLVEKTFVVLKRLNLNPLEVDHIPLSRIPNEGLWCQICSELGLDCDYKLQLKIKSRWTRNTQDYRAEVITFFKLPLYPTCP